MALDLSTLETLTTSPAAEAWSAIVKKLLEIASKPLTVANAPSEVIKRDRAVGELDHFLSSSGWDLWQAFGETVERTSDHLVRWWSEPYTAKAVLILDGLSLRELPWLLQGAKERGFTLHEVTANASELPGETNEFAHALGFGSRSQLQNNGGGSAHKLQPAYTECVDLPWKDCAALVNGTPNWVLWHQWPDRKVHEGAGAGQGLDVLIRDAAEQLGSDDFWALVERLATGRRLVITSDHGYAATGYFPDADGDVGVFLKKTFSSGRGNVGTGDTGPFVPPVAMHINSPHGDHILAIGRWKWRSQGGYPTMTHGGLSLLEVVSPSSSSRSKGSQLMANKKEQLAQEVSRAVGAGRIAALETVDFNDPDRPKTCLEVDFPILPVNQVAIIEGNAGKPIYQMSKWWARRRSSVFRSMLIAAATKAPDEPSNSAKVVWDNYYANHQKKGSFKDVKVADIFMGGGTTLVEGSRLGMKMTGNDLNPVAWFVVKQELADVDLNEVRCLLGEIEAAVKPQIMPYYYCDGPNGEKGKWTHLPSGRTEEPDFDPLTIEPDVRNQYRYDGPEIIYTFWAKHGPCQVTGCGHRTAIMSSPVMAIKTLSVKYWEHCCSRCGRNFDVEEEAARMAPDVPLCVAPTEKPFSILDRKMGVVCPHCGKIELVKLGKSLKKKVDLTLLVHPEWLAGAPKQDADGQSFGGSVQDDSSSTARWGKKRASTIRLLEVRGELPAEVTCPETNVTFRSDEGTVPKRSNYVCSACGTVQDVLTTVKASGQSGPMGGYAIQGYAPTRDNSGALYNGRFFAPFDSKHAAQYDAANREWEMRKDEDLNGYWPVSSVPYGFMTHMNNGGIANHGFTHWWTMFNPRQMLVQAQLLKAIQQVGEHTDEVREYVLGAFQQYLRNQNLFCFWDIGYDKLVPHMSNNNYHPKTNIVENCVFASLGRGNWASCVEGILQGREWAQNPWEAVSTEGLKRQYPAIASAIKGKSEKVFPGDPLLGAEPFCGSSTELNQFPDRSIDLVITDPPFGGLLHYSELADFFYVWLRLALKDKYPQYFSAEYTPKTLEAVANRAREPEDPDGFYQRLLTQCWREAHRILKPSGLLAFTFHHSEDEPWVAVLESLFDAGFYLEATYPIRSDETKGEGAKPGTFGSQTIEYDIIHVCRKRTEEPKPVSWGRMRREVMSDVRQLQSMLENHVKEGLPAADIQVIRRGKALEYFSRHYGKVYVDEGRTISVKDALIGINQLIDEDADKGKEPPPVNSEPMTRQFLRTFGEATTMEKNQLQKFLKGSITTPDEFEQRGWCSEKNKVITRVDPLDFAREWSGKHRRRLTSDLDQALVLIGACVDGSGINASDTLKNENFKPHVALKSLLDWFNRNGTDQPTRNAASRAFSIYNAWAASQATQPKQGSLFEEYEL